MADPIVNDQQTVQTNDTDINLDINFDDISIPEDKKEVVVSEPKEEKVSEPVIIEPEIKVEDITTPSPKKEVVIEPVVEKIDIEPVTEEVVAEEPIVEEEVIEPQIKAGVTINPFPKKEVTEKPVVKEPVAEVEEIVSIDGDSEEVADEEPIVEEEVIEEEPVAKEEKSDLKKKFDELSSNISNISKIEKKDAGQSLEILGANNDKVSILYQINMPDGDIQINKIETDNQTEEEVINELSFVFDHESDSISVMLDDVLLFNEIDHLKDDPKKKMQVIDKLNKFIFLTSEQLKKIEKEIKEKEAEEMERKRLQDIFRNF